MKTALPHAMAERLAGLGPDTCLPDPANDLAVLARRILARFGGGPAATGGVAPAWAGRTLVLLVVDGLGLTYLASRGAGGFLASHLIGEVSSVFPCTTASAITTLMTGLSPVSHGLTGWFIRDERFGGVLAPLPLELRGGGPLQTPLLTPRLFPYRTLFQRLNSRSVVVSPRQIAESPFNRRHSRGARPMAYEGLSGLLMGVDSAVASLGAEGGYVYAYLPDFDSLAHCKGVGSDAARALFWRIDGAAEALAARLGGRGVDLLITADHGFQDIPPERVLRLEEWPEVLALLAAPLWGERRMAWCQARSGQEVALARALEARLAGRGVVLPAAGLVAAGFLGQGRAHRRLVERLGSHAILMASGWILQDTVPGERPHVMVGYHGGLSRAEMVVPLIHVPA